MTHHTITFDTLFYANQLKSVGVPEKQAETQATLAKKQNDDILALIDDSLATKYDIELVKRDIKELETKLEAKIELVKKDLIIILTTILGSIMVVCIGVSTTILGYLIKLY